MGNQLDKPNTDKYMKNSKCVEERLVCWQHIEDKFLLRPEHNRLLNNAVPTIVNAANSPELLTVKRKLHDYHPPDEYFCRQDEAPTAHDEPETF